MNGCINVACLAKRSSKVANCPLKSSLCRTCQERSIIRSLGSPCIYSAIRVSLTFISKLGSSRWPLSMSALHVLFTDLHKEILFPDSIFTFHPGIKSFPRIMSAYSPFTSLSRGVACLLLTLLIGLIWTKSGFTSNSMDTVTLKTETTYPYSNCKMISEKLTSKMIP